MLIEIHKVRVGPGPSPTDEQIDRLAESIAKIGMHAPIAVLADGDTFVVQAGRTRLAAHKKLGRDWIEAEVFTDAHQAALWSIAENLHRKDLTAMERAKEEDRWLKEVAKGEGANSSQVATKKPRSHRATGKRVGRKKGGTRAAARKVDISKDQAARSHKIAGLSDAAQRVAKELGLDNNQKALLKAAAQPTPDGEVAALRRHAEILTKRKAAKEHVPSAERDGGAYPSPAQMIKSWYDTQHPGIRQQIMGWLRTVDIAEVIAVLSEGEDPIPGDGLEFVDRLGGSIH